MSQCNKLLGVALLLLLFSCGCFSKKPSDETKPQRWRNVVPGSQFQVVVIGDQAIAGKISQLVGTWEDMTQSTFTVREISVEEVIQKKQEKFKDIAESDAVIAPLELEGLFLEQNYPTAIATDSKTFPHDGWNDLLELQKTQMTRCGGETRMIPLGSQFYVCYFRSDLLEKIGEEPPKTWADYGKLCEKLRQNFPESPDWTASLEPTVESWAARSFLARAAAYAMHRDFYSVLFDLTTMEPLVNTEPFVRALTEMKAACSSGTGIYPSDIRNAFWSGKCGLALTFPSSQDKAEVAVPKELTAGIAALPGAVRSYNPQSKQWDARPEEENNQVPTMVAGRMAMISAQSQKPEGTLDLLLWLSGEEWGTDVLASSSSVGISRKSQLHRPTSWTEKQMSPKTVSQYVTVLTKQMNGSEVLVVPSLPGQEKYMQILDENVRQTLEGKWSPQEALDAVAREWKTVTEEYGLESQKKIYRQCCGLSVL
ncbi:MAG: extracellular solute-binding protein [Planctomycetaceae bacterium]|nr:extracellular solute-binding protein [Planctomycetaceae bacterium]